MAMAMARATSFVLAMVVGLAMVSMVAGAGGLAMYYTPSYVPSACYGFQEQGTTIAAASLSLWNDGAVCGQHYKVTCTGATNEGVPHPCTGRSVIVKMVDLCPEGCRGTIDLSQEAFAVIANPDAGKVQIEFHRV